MSNKEKILDKYWLEFLESEGTRGMYQMKAFLSEECFWEWFYLNKVKPNQKLKSISKLEEYLNEDN